LYVPLCRKCYFTTPHANSENLWFISLWTK
jgi:hypothetical protein